MGLEGLPFQLIQVPFSKGLSTKDDPRASDPPSLAICRDAEFDSLGALRTRAPFIDLGTDVVGGGSLTNVRRIVANGDELLCFTDVAVYGWVSIHAAWALRGTHLAVHVDESTRFETTDDQGSCDRARLNGITFVAWADTAQTVVWVAAYDASTGAIALSPTSSATFANSDVRRQPRLVALQTRVLLVVENYTARKMEVQAIDPSSLALGGFTQFGATCNNGVGTGSGTFDACQVIGTDTAAIVSSLNPATSYQVATVTAALSIAVVTKARAANVTAISSTPDGLHLQVVRSNSTNVQGDLLLTSTLADVFTAQAIGTALTVLTLQIACAHRSVKNGGQYRCYVFWVEAVDTTGFAPGAVKFNWVDDGGALGSQANFVADLDIASRAFDYNGSVYVNLAFCGNTFAQAPSGTFSAGVQNTYYLYRDDGFRAAKSVVDNANGPSLDFAHSSSAGLHPGNLPGVQQVSAGVFAWCGMERRIIASGTHKSGFSTFENYAARTPREVTYSFDDDRARRVARLGLTSYVSGAEIQQYDGQQLVELGFNTMPWQMQFAGTGSGGHLSAGVYAAKGTWRWDNAQGERDRSSSIAVFQATMVANDTLSTTLTSPPLRTTSKPNVTLEIWRTPVNPNADSEFNLASSQDPSASTNPNRYLANVGVTSATSEPLFTDVLSDLAIGALELNPEAEGVLENLAPPSASIVIAGDIRLFVADVPGDPDRVWYSKQRSVDQVAAFNDALVFPVPSIGGRITGLAIHRETLFVFRATATYQLDGVGFDNTGGGSNYGPAHSLARDVGAVAQEAIAATPMGIVHKSNKGWYLTELGATPRYIGASVAAYDGDTVRSVTVVESQHQVRVVTDQRVLVWDYFVDQWAEWTVGSGVDGCMWNGSHVVLTAAGPKIQTSDMSLVDYGMDVETSWVKPGGLQGRAHVRVIQLLGEVRGNHDLRVRVAVDYLEDGAGNAVYVDDVLWPCSPVVIGSSEQVRHGPSRKLCQAMKVRVTAVAAGATLPSPTPPSGDALRLTSIALDAAVEPGLYSGLSPAQRD